jgi:hypothetical protein
MKLLILIPLLILFSCACKKIKYEADIAALNSAQAGSYEYLVNLNGSPCIDMDKQVGLCAKRIPSDKSLVFTQDPRPYEYKINIQCSKAIDADYYLTVPKDTAFKYEIHHDKFIGVKSFTCIGEIVPSDRDQEVSATWMARIVVYDGAYLPRTSIYEITDKKKKYLIFGKHAKYSNFNGKWYKEKTVMRLKGDGKYKAYSESERMRFNYLGF